MGMRLRISASFLRYIAYVKFKNNNNNKKTPDLSDIKRTYKITK